MAVKIVHDIKACIGCGACAAICPENWEMSGDKSRCKNTAPKAVGCNRQAADSCPVSCIHVTEK